MSNLNQNRKPFLVQIRVKGLYGYTWEFAKKYGSYIRFENEQSAKAFAEGFIETSKEIDPEPKLARVVKETWIDDHTVKYDVI